MFTASIYIYICIFTQVYRYLQVFLTHIKIWICLFMIRQNEWINTIANYLCLRRQHKYFVSSFLHEIKQTLLNSHSSSLSLLFTCFILITYCMTWWKVIALLIFEWVKFKISMGLTKKITHNSNSWLKAIKYVLLAQIYYISSGILNLKYIL